VKIERLSPAMIERWLAAHELDADIDDRGNCTVNLIAGAQRPAYRFAVCFSGRERNVLIVEMTTQESYPEQARARFETVANRWNRDMLWPTAVVEPTDHGVRLVARSGFNFAAGVHQELIDDFLFSNVLGAGDLLAEGHAAVAGAAD
jgi:hypothetical protein